jgi:tetratricopeptide (TPR) repeat protein
MSGKAAWLAAVAAAAVLAGCAQTGAAGGSGALGGCKTVYVFRPAAGGSGGAVTPISACGGLPREALAPAQVQTASSGSISPAAAATRADNADYGGDIANMLEGADMAALIERARQNYDAEENSGAWGYLIIDRIAAGDVPGARQILNALSAKPPAPQMGARHLAPWVLALEGRGDEAKRAMSDLRSSMPEPTLIGNRALMAEGLGDIDGALALYAEETAAFEAPNPEEAGSASFFAQSLAFGAQRLHGLRQAELLMAVNRDSEAVALLERLVAADDDDAYVASQLAKAKRKQGRTAPRTLRQAMAVAIADQSDKIEERQLIIDTMSARGAKSPFNHLVASMRQSALLLDPDNGDVRLTAVNGLYNHGHFASALRLAQLGSPRSEEAAGLATLAGMAALELGSPETLKALVDQGVAIDKSVSSRLFAASALISADASDRAVRLIDQALAGSLSEPERISALLTKAQALHQAGDGQGAVREARKALAIDERDATRQYLASMLVLTPQREEGLKIMRDMLIDQPGNTGMMNNLGYALVDGHVSEAELEEGYKLLKEASRITPDEPNLLDSVGWAYYFYGDFKEAERYISLALDNYKPFHNWELHDHMGDIQWRLGEEAAAREQWKAALAARPPRAERPGVEAKLKDGMTAPAPVRRDTPEVPLNRQRGAGSDI